MSRSSVVLLGADAGDLGALKETDAYSHLLTSSVDLVEIEGNRNGSGGLTAEQVRGAAAVVFVLTRNAMEDEKFRQSLKLAVREAYERIDFRCFILFHGIDQDTFFNLGGVAETTVSDVKMGVHISGIQDAELLLRTMFKYLDEMPALSAQYDNYYAALRRRSIIYNLALRVRHLLFEVMAFITVGSVFWAMWANRVMAVHESTSFLLLFGVCLGMSIRAPLCMMTWGREIYWPNMLKIECIVAMLTLGGAIWLIYHNHSAPAWIGVGFLLYTLLDNVVRYHAKSAIEFMSLKPNVAQIFDSQQASSSIMAVEPQANRAAHGQSRFYEFCPIFTCPSRKSVFISYSHHGEWGAKTAKGLSAFMTSNGVEHFWDKRIIPEGASWRFWVFSGIHQCGLFLLLLDKESAKSTWAATESEFALRTMYKVGSPQFVVVCEEDYLLASEDRTETLPRFHAICWRLFGTHFGQGTKSLPQTAPRGVVATQSDLDNLKQELLERTLAVPGLVSPFLYPIIRKLPPLLDRLSAGVVAATTFATYFFLFDRSVLTRLTITPFFTAMVFAIVFAFGYLSRSAWVIVSAIRNGSMSFSFGRVFAIFGYLIIMVPAVYFSLGFILPLQLIAVMMTMFGWLAHRFSSGGNDLPPVWSILSLPSNEKKVEYE